MFLEAGERQGRQTSVKVTKGSECRSHDELVEEMKRLSRLPMEQRMTLAKSRRKEQLRWYLMKEEEEKRRSKVKKGETRVRFDCTSRLFAAIADGDVNEVRHLITSGKCDKDATNCYGMTSLHQSCVNYNLGLVHVLVRELSADISKPDLDLWTPLHTVALLGFADLAKFLLDNDADVLALNKELNMPYDICEEPSTLNIIEMNMVEKGVTQEKIEQLRMGVEEEMMTEIRDAHNSGRSLVHTGANRETFLHVAASMGYKEVTNFLLANTSISLDAVDDDGWQPIHCASYWNQLNVVEILMERGVSIYAKTADGESALDLCRDEMMKDWMLQKEVEDSHFVKKASCIIRSSRRASVQDTSGSSHFDSIVSLTDLNKFSHCSKRLNAEKKEEKKKKDLRHEYQSLLASLTDDNHECDSLLKKSKPIQEIPRRSDKKSTSDAAVRHNNSLKDQTRSRNKADQSNPQRPKSGYVSIYNNHLDHYGCLNFQGNSAKQNFFDEFQDSVPSHRSASTPHKTSHTPSLSSPANENLQKKVRDDSSVRGLHRMPVLEYHISGRPSGQESTRSGSLTTSKVDSFDLPKRVNSNSDVFRLTDHRFNSGEDKIIREKSRGKNKKPKNEAFSAFDVKPNKKGLSGKCAIS